MTSSLKPIRARHEVRFGTGTTIRVMSMHFMPHERVTVRYATGMANEPVVEFVRKYGNREAMLVLPTRERWLEGLSSTEARKRHSRWTTTALRDGLTQTYTVEDK